jgi:phage terminase large subunit-like protein
VDELHAQPNRDLVDVLVTSTGSRRQPLVWYITTADFDRESICNEKYADACAVRDGLRKDAAFLPVIYEAQTTDDWTDPRVWARANPNLGVSISRDYLERECQRARETPTYENTFKRLHLNIRTQNDVRWLHIESWDACNGEVDPEQLAGRECFGALDLSSKIDLTAWVLVFPPTPDDRMWRVLPRFWIPADNIEPRERRDRVPYGTWERQGLIDTTPGNVVDYDFIKAAILDDARRFTIRGIAYDPWNATQISLQLAADGANVMEFRQGYHSMSEPTKELEKLVLQKAIAHGGNAVLRWMAGNTAVDMDPAGNMKPSKKKSTERVDGIVATVMALGLAIGQPVEGPSVYDSRGVITL